LTFFATCSYSIDLSNLKQDDVEINKDTEEINVTLPNLEIFSINIDESKTIYSQPDLGMLRFGDIKISTEKLGYIRTKVTESFKNKMNDEGLHSEAISNTTILLENLISNLTEQSFKINIITK